jgi:hypothetical protein
MATTSRSSGDLVDEAQARRLLDAISDVSGEASVRLSAAAGSAGDAVREADRQLRDSSDQTLSVIGGLSVGFAGGLLVGGAPRLLVLMSLAPAMLVGMAALDRLDRGARGRRSNGTS